MLINEAIVSAGLAWHYVKYSDDQKLADAEFEARTTKRGLWGDNRAIPPWDWRRLSRDDKARANGIATSAPSNSEPKTVMSYWITNSSNKRHNSSCRWYKKSKRATLYGS